jgi:hypothetical protein
MPDTEDRLMDQVPNYKHTLAQIRAAWEALHKHPEAVKARENLFDLGHDLQAYFGRVAGHLPQVNSYRQRVDEEMTERFLALVQ